MPRRSRRYPSFSLDGREEREAVRFVPTHLNRLDSSFTSGGFRNPTFPPIDRFPALSLRVSSTEHLLRMNPMRRSMKTRLLSLALLALFPSRAAADAVTAVSEKDFPHARQPQLAVDPAGKVFL